MDCQVRSMDDKKIPVVDWIGEIAKLPEIDKTKEVEVMSPVYQDGKLVALWRTVYLPPMRKDDEYWGGEKFIHPKDRTIKYVKGFPE